jgi:hypothetical protein
VLLQGVRQAPAGASGFLLSCPVVSGPAAIGPIYRTYLSRRSLQSLQIIEYAPRKVNNAEAREKRLESGLFVGFRACPGIARGVGRRHAAGPSAGMVAGGTAGIGHHRSG